MKGLSNWIPVVAILAAVACVVLPYATGSPRFIHPIGVVVPSALIIATVWTAMGCRSIWRSVANGLISWLGLSSMILMVQSTSHPVDVYRPVGWDGVLFTAAVGIVILAVSLLVSICCRHPRLVFFDEADEDRMSLADLLVALSLAGTSLGAFRFAGVFESEVSEVQIQSIPYEDFLWIAISMILVVVLGCLLATVYVVWTARIRQTPAGFASSNSMTFQTLLLLAGLTAIAVAEGTENVGTTIVASFGFICVIQATVFFALFAMRQFGRNNLAHWLHVQGERQKRYDGPIFKADRRKQPQMTLPELMDED